jgi:hypothetical protein
VQLFTKNKNNCKNSKVEKRVLYEVEQQRATTSQIEELFLFLLLTKFTTTIKDEHVQEDLLSDTGHKIRQSIMGLIALTSSALSTYM